MDSQPANNLIASTTSFPSHGFPPQQPQDALLLRMLVPELIDSIAKGLSRMDQYNLMQVSCAFRILLRDRFDRRTLTKESEEQMLDYLQARALTLPYHWACHECIGMHRASLFDTPLYGGGCFTSFVRGQARHALSAPSPYHFSGYYLKHHHIQLALKYHRLGGYHGPHAHWLRCLLTSYTYTPNQRPRPTLHFEFHALGVGTYACEPRVASDRFLLKTRLEFFGLGESPPAIRMCHHQEYSPAKLRMLHEYRRQVTVGATLTNAAMAEYRQLRWISNGVLCRAMVVLMDHKHTVLNMSCPFCPTDIRVTRTATKEGFVRYEAVSWHDYGGEGRPPDPRWRAEYFGLVTADHMRDDSPPGTAKALWEDSDAWRLRADFCPPLFC